MEFKLIEDICHNYMSISLENSIVDFSYKFNMILNNKIKGLLKTSTRVINNNTSLYYEISSKQTLESKLENSKIGYEEIKQLLIALFVCIEEVEKYLLDVNDIILVPSMIFWNIDNNSIEFCYYPNLDKNFKQEFNTLLQYLLTKVNHADSKAVILSYDLHDITIRSNYSIKEMLEKLTQIDDSKENISNKQVDINSDLNSIYDNKNKDKKLISIKIFVVGYVLVLIFILVGYYILNQNIYSQYSFITLVIILGIITLFIYQRIMDAMYQNEDDLQVNIECDNLEIVFENTMILNTLEENDEFYLEYIGIEEIENIFVNISPFVIGKLEEKVSYAIQEPSISRIHARITKSEQEYFIEDLNSTNGTYINDKRIGSYNKTKIEHGDIIMFARLPFKFIKNTIN